MTLFTQSLVRVIAVCLFVGTASSARAFQSDGSRGSRNVELISHLPLGGMKSASGSASAGFESLGRNTGYVLLEQESGRPHAFVGTNGDEPGVLAINIADPSSPFLAGSWNASYETGELIHFRHGSRYYLVVTQPAYGASILEVGDPDEGQFDPVLDIIIAGGLHHGFAYRHSNGRSYLFLTGGQDILVYDIDRLVTAKEADPVASIQLPEEKAMIDYGYYSMKAQYEAESESDRLYAAGAGGYYVLDVTDVQNPAPLASINSAAIRIGHSISATPDGSHVITGTGYRTAPMRIFDLRPVFDGTISMARTAVGAWTADWESYVENHELRWPFVFTASLDQGLQVFNMMNPFEPYTVGYYRTWDGPKAGLSNDATDRTGAWDVDVRNLDGLIAVTDANTGLWLFQMEGFEGWDGRGWGFPNVSAVQNCDNGPTESSRW